MKKAVAILIAVAIFVTAAVGFFKPIAAKAYTGQVIYSCDFEEESDLDDWATLNNYGFIEQSV